MENWNNDLGSLSRKRPREIWRHEATDFTRWLAQHINELGAALELDLEVIRTESRVGDFAVDILARDLAQEDRTVIIENQLEVTDHRHLGQLLTYAAGEDACAVVWVSPEFREEHRAVLDWLNRGLAGNTAFFGVVVEVLQIEDSKPAVNFRVVARPAGSKSPSRVSPEGLSDRALRYQGFFQELVDVLREEHGFTNSRVGRPQNWYAFATGVSGFQYCVAFKRQACLSVELYIDLGDGEYNLAALKELQADATRIEQEVGEPLVWEELQERRACRVAVQRPGSILDPQDKLEEELGWAIERLLAFRKVFGPRLREMPDRSEQGDAA